MPHDRRDTQHTGAAASNAPVSGLIATASLTPLVRAVLLLLLLLLLRTLLVLVALLRFLWLAVVWGVSDHHELAFDRVCNEWCGGLQPSRTKGGGGGVEGVKTKRERESG